MVGLAAPAQADDPIDWEDPATWPGRAAPAPTTALVGGYAYNVNASTFAGYDMANVNFVEWAFTTIGDPNSARDGMCSLPNTNAANAVAAAKAANPHAKFLVSLGGWGARNFSTASDSPEDRQKLVASCIATYLDTGLVEGFDIDWEFPYSGGLPNVGIMGPDDKANLNLLVVEFRDQLDAWADAHNTDPDDLWITAAIPAGRWEDSGDGVTGGPYELRDGFDLDFLGSRLNTLNIMTYEMGTGYVPVSMHNQPLYPDPKDNTGDPYNSGVTHVQMWLDEGVPADKIIYGGMYTGGRGFVVQNTDNGGMWQPWSGTGCGNGSNAVNLAAAKNDSRNVLIYWDDVTKNHWLFDPGQLRVCSIETPQSLAERAKWAKDNGLSGFYSWTLGTSGAAQGYPEIRAVGRVFHPEWYSEPAAPVVNGVNLDLAAKAFDGEVARVVGSSATSLTAVINWGDLTRSTAEVVDLGGGEWSVRGSHTYAAPGQYKLTVATFDPLPINSVYANAWLNVNAEDEDIIVGVQPGLLSLTVPNNQVIDLGQVTLNGLDQYIGGYLNVAQVVDARGTKAGWTLSGVATNFTGPLGGQISAQNLGWSPTASVIPTGGLVGSGTPPAVTAGPVVTPAQNGGLATAKVLCSADAGSSQGQFLCGGPLQLGIPFDTPSDQYASVLTLTLV
ncbi:MAG: hypothetical protein LBK95_01105 [Bifidobacteriaceae bacterium]|jgi:chitinase|nr:hypothetical protein [Bifidobacteriaceae bacterium]